MLWHKMEGTYYTRGEENLKFLRNLMFLEFLYKYLPFSNTDSSLVFIWLRVASLAMLTPFEVKRE